MGTDISCNCDSAQTETRKGTTKRRRSGTGIIPLLSISFRDYEYAESSSESEGVDDSVIPMTPEISYAEFDGNTISLRAEIEPSPSAHSMVTLNLNDDTDHQVNVKMPLPEPTPPPPAFP